MNQQQIIDTGKNFQSMHHGIEIPRNQQPVCPKCGGGMATHIPYGNDKPVATWQCLDRDCESKPVDFEDWLSDFPVSEAIRNHFGWVGLSAPEIAEIELRQAGFEKIGGHTWGGGWWGKLDGLKAWTGYKGECLEYWEKKAD